MLFRSESGMPSGGCSASEQEIKGLKIPGDRFIKVDLHGKLEVIADDEISLSWNAVKDGKNYGCGLTPYEFTCGGYSGGGRFAEWGTSCTIREFLQGDLQDFPLSYMPDDFHEIITQAELIHRRISGVEIYTFTHNEH